MIVEDWVLQLTKYLREEGGPITGEALLDVLYMLSQSRNNGRIPSTFCGMLYENYSYSGGHLSLSRVLGNEDATAAAPNNLQSNSGGGGIVHFIQLSLVHGSDK